jgi:hypothetical protein
MPNLAIPRHDVHRISEACAEDGERYRGIAARLLKQQKRLLSFFKANLPSMTAQTGEVSVYLFSVVVQIFDQSGGDLPKVNGRQINAAAARVQRLMDGLLPFDEGFAERVRTIDDRAQPHILDEALWALFERAQRKDGEVDVELQQAGLIFVMLWVAAEALDSAWRAPADLEQRIADAPEWLQPEEEEDEDEATEDEG